MTLSARIRIAPSRRVTWLSALVPAAGVVIAGATLALRDPRSLPFLAISVLAGCGAAVGSALRRTATPRTLVVSQHPEIDVEPDPLGDDGGWHLAESTVVSPAFAMLALRPADRSVRAPVLRLPVFTSELASDDRWALSRFLVWSLHRGSRAGGPSSHP